MPFKPAGATKDDFQISPTVPFKTEAQVAGGASREPRRDAEFQLSPTMPFKVDVAAGGKQGKAEDLEISPTLPFQRQSSSGDGAAAEESPAAAEADATSAGPKRSSVDEVVVGASRAFDLDEDDLMEATAADPLDAEMAMATQTSEREREWQKHKRTVERKQLIDQVKAAKLREEREAK